MDERIEDLRSNDEPELDLLFQAGDEVSNYEYTADDSTGQIIGFWDHSVAITPESLVVEWEFDHPPLTIANYYNSNYIGGTLSVNDLATPGTIEFPHRPSNTDVPAREDKTYEVRSDTLRMYESVYSQDNLLQHHHWLHNPGARLQGYLLTDTITYSLEDNYETRAYFQPIDTIVVANEAGGDISIQDPWISQNRTEFQPVENGTHEVFLNQYPDQGPIYSIRAPSFVPGASNVHHFFRRWTGADVLFDDDDITADRQTPVVFLSNNATATAEYYQFTVNGASEVYAQGGEAVLVAPDIGEPTMTDILVFDHWSADPAGSVSFTGGTNNRTTRVIIHEDNATITANYDAVNQIPGYILTVPVNENLTLQAGGNYALARDFRFDVIGDFIAEGDEGNKIRMYGPSGEWNGLSASVAQNITLNYVRIEDTKNALSTGGVNDLFIANSILEGNVSLENVSNTSTTTINNVTIHSADSIALALNRILGEVQINGLRIFDAINGLDIRNMEIEGHLLIENSEIYPERVGIAITNIAEERRQVEIKNSVVADGDLQSGNVGIDIDLQPMKDYENTRVFLTNVTVTNHWWGVKLTNSDGDQDRNEVVATDCIIWGNTSEDVYWREQGNIWLRYSDFSEPHIDPLQNEGNISLNPTFVDPSNSKYYLAWQSPCIDAGDPNMEDPDETVADMGAYYHPQLSGQIANNMTWDGAVSIGGDLSIQDGATVNITPGTEVAVRMREEEEFRVSGTLHALGDANNPVQFFNTDNSEWSGIRAFDAEIILHNAVIADARTGLTATKSEGEINNCVFEDNKTGVVLDHSKFEMYSNVIRENNRGLRLQSSPAKLIGNNIEGNADYGVYSYRSSAFLKENTLRFNRDGLVVINKSDHDLVVGRDASAPDVNNRIAENERYGVYIDDSSNPLLGYYEYNAGVGLYTGGFNDYRPGNGDYDVYSEQPVTVDARLNWWPSSPQIDGNLEIEPTARQLGLGKSVASITSETDSIPLTLLEAVSLELDSAFTEASNRYATFIEENPTSPYSQMALSGLVRVHYKTETESTLLPTLVAYHDQYAPELIGLAALDYAISVLVDIGEYEEALTQMGILLPQYEAAGTLAEEAAAVMFEEIFVYYYLQEMNAGLGKMTQEQIHEQFKEKLAALMKWYGETISGELANTMYEDQLKEITDRLMIPQTTELLPVYPNPFNPSTTISYGLPETGYVKITIFDLRGQIVTTLVDEEREPGQYTVQWHGTDRYGHQVASGVYFYRFQSSGVTMVQKMVLIR